MKSSTKSSSLSSGALNIFLRSLVGRNHSRVFMTHFWPLTYDFDVKSPGLTRCVLNIN